MQKQTIEFAVTRKSGIITRIGRTVINQPKTDFKDGSAKYYEDKRKQIDK